jgi:hypothetical protein
MIWLVPLKKLEVVGVPRLQRKTSVSTSELAIRGVAGGEGRGVEINLLESPAPEGVAEISEAEDRGGGKLVLKQ